MAKLTKQHKENIRQGMTLSKNIGNVKLKAEEIPEFQGKEKQKIIALLEAGLSGNQIMKLRDASGNLVIPGRRQINLVKFKNTTWYFDKNKKPHSLNEIKPLTDANKNVKTIQNIIASVRPKQQLAKMRKPSHSIIIDQVYATGHDYAADVVSEWLKTGNKIKTKLETAKVKPGHQNYEKMAAEGQTRRFQVMIYGQFKNLDTGKIKRQNGFTENIETLENNKWGEYIFQAIAHAQYKCGGTNWQLIKLYKLAVLQRDYII